MNIPFVDLKSRFKEEQKYINNVLNKILKSGNLILSKDVVNFEQQICKKLNVKYCLGVNSGTDALMLALWGLGIKKNDEVITTSVSFIATAGSIAHLGAKPVFVECGLDLNIDPKKIENAITKKTKAIMPVHWTGRMSDIKEIYKIAKKYKLFIIEDAAQAAGASIDNIKPGQLSDAAAFSAHPLKPLNALGDAGYLVTNNKKLYEKIKLYRNHGLIGREDTEFYGINSRLDGIHAGVLSLRLEKLNAVITKRKRNIDLYRRKIKAKEFYIIPEKENEVNSYAMFVSLAERRDELNDFLKKNGIESIIYYANPLHLHKSSVKTYNYKKGDLPISENICKKVISLPFHQNIKKKEIIHISKLVNKFYKN
jgi:dTDP-4-amino-4,6-dideoxygalactose transaminase